MRRQSEAAQRYAERRQREQEAPRLRDEAPDLHDLRLEVEERRGVGAVVDAKHIRRVMVEHAPAYFFVACGDSSCKNGGHDITYSVMRGLRSGAVSFEGESSCSGTIGSADCSRRIRWIATATYREEHPQP